MRASRVCFPLLGLALLTCATAPAHAAWPRDPNVNVPLCTAASYQVEPAVIPDGAGGAIVVWRDYRGDYYDLYAQRVDARGDVQWAADGVVLCTGTGPQEYPHVTSDGSGGAIVTWYDLRGAAYDIYAQRVDASGAVQWTANGVPLCTATGHQSYPTIIADGSGGAIIAWYDYRGGATPDPYAQRVSADGVAQWTANGVALCTSAGIQISPAIVLDGSGGAIFAWQDYRSGSRWDVYAQRVNSGGVVQWAANGVALAVAYNHTFLSMVSDGSGGAIATWQDSRGGTYPDIYAQRVSAGGAVQWAANGVALCAAANEQECPTTVSDGSGGVIAAWQDSRGGTYRDIYAQRMSAAGVAQWTTDGVALCAATNSQGKPTITPDGSGGAIVVWQDSRGGSDADLYAQRVSAAGVAQWVSDGVALCTAPGNQIEHGTVSDGSGGAIVAWEDYRGGTYSDIYAQRVDPWGYVGSVEPVIVSVLDLPDDQGGRVRIKWEASYVDTLPTMEIGIYGLWRRVTESVAATAIARGAVRANGDGAGRAALGVIRAGRAGSGTTWWEGVGTVAARGEAWYTFVAETFQDSSAAGNPYTAFMVDAHAAFAPRFWDSPPDSGYSVDNLPPVTPTSFSGEYASGTATLGWGENGETDLAAYRLHRGHGPDFVPGPENLVVEQAGTGYVDAAGAPFCYKLCAVDVHGNASGYATLLPNGAVDVGGPAPAALALSLGSANPARRSAVLRWALPAEGEARLVVHDVTGRVMRELATGHASAGEHATRWDGRDGSGALAPAGMYVARLEAAGRGLSVRFVLVR